MWDLSEIRTLCRILTETFSPLQTNRQGPILSFQVNQLQTAHSAVNIK